MLFRTPSIEADESRVIAEVDDLRANLKYAIQQSRRWTGILRRAALARAIQGSNSIEGYNVTVDDAIAAIDGEEPLDAKTEAWAAVTGYRRAMSYVLQLSDDPHFSHTTTLLRSLHYMMLEYDLAKHPGKWRPGPIYVRNEGRQEIVYEGPGAEDVPELMDELAHSLNEVDSTPVLVRAAMAHLNLVMVHPFSDGNGRMGRCLQTLVLAREGILGPQFCSIEEYLGHNTQPYYDVLAEVGEGSWHPSNDAQSWVRFCLTAHYRQALTLLRRTREMHKLWDAIEFEVRKYDLQERTMLALADAALGFRVRNASYRTAAEVSDHVASLDLKVLVDRGLLIPRGERRGRYYVASDWLRSIRKRTRESRPVLDDPFEKKPRGGLVYRP